MNKENLVNCILHTIRNSELLCLSVSIQIASMKGIDVSEIEESYKAFATNLELRIRESIDDYEN